MVQPGEDGKTFEMFIRNLDYICWKKDQSLVAYITATLSKDVLYTISDDMSARDLWVMLPKNYSQVSRIMDYLAELKTVCDSLAAVETPIPDKEQVQHILCTLGSEYGMFCTALQVLPVLPSLSKLKAKLLQYEVQFTDNMTEATLQILYSDQHSSIKDHGPHGISHSSGRGQADIFRKGLLPTPYGMPTGRGNIPTCYLCNKKEHIKANCWYNLNNRNKQHGTRGSNVPEHTGGQMLYTGQTQHTVSPPMMSSHVPPTSSPSTSEMHNLLVNALSQMSVKQDESGH
ncbi:unnamed protein product [Victoria cruziana]